MKFIGIRVVLVCKDTPSTVIETSSEIIINSINVLTLNLFLMYETCFDHYEVADIRNRLMLEHLRCCIGLITIEDNFINTTHCFTQS